MQPVLLDSSVIAALFDRRERYHRQCAELVAGLHRPLTTCEAVISESCYLLAAIPGAPEYVLRNVVEGVFSIPFQFSDSASEVLAIFEKYRDLPASLADACLIQMADEFDTGDILTLDSDFKHYRWRRNRSFRLLIPLEQVR